MKPIVVDGLTKRFGSVTAVDDLSFEVEAGRVTGFLGPNGAGKTTTLRALLGLVQPTRGAATFGGVRYADLPTPLRHVGAVLEASSFHPGRRAVDHLRVVATAADVPLRRVGEVLGEVGLDAAAGRRVGGFSLGMRQRLGLATALLGDPEVLVLDEPTNGLDPDGMRWLRRFVRARAAEGRTVLVSSHVLSEVAQTVDDVVIVRGGRLAAQGPLAEVASGAAGVRLRTPDAEAARRVFAESGLDVADDDDGGLLVHGASPDVVGAAIARAGLAVYELRPLEARLDDVFFDLTERSGR